MMNRDDPDQIREKDQNRDLSQLIASNLSTLNEDIREGLTEDPVSEDVS